MLCFAAVTYVTARGQHYHGQFVPFPAALNTQADSNSSVDNYDFEDMAMVCATVVSRHPYNLDCDL